MRIDVAFTPAEAAAAPTGIVVDVIRATSTICQALASGYARVFCTSEVDEARTLRAELGDGVLGGERKNVRIDGFDLGNSPREYLEPLGET
ncbi:MAG: 2-phosphosulfolactate phosphatase, partial [Actinobacteria bacterium]